MIEKPLEHNKTKPLMWEVEETVAGGQEDKEGRVDC